MRAQLAEKQLEILRLVFSCDSIVSMVVTQAVIVLGGVPSRISPEELLHVRRSFVEQLERGFELVERAEGLLMLESPGWRKFQGRHVLWLALVVVEITLRSILTLYRVPSTCQRTQAEDTIVHFTDGLTAMSDVWSVVDLAETVVTVSSRSVGESAIATTLVIGHYLIWYDAWNVNIWKKIA